MTTKVSVNLPMMWRKKKHLYNLVALTMMEFLFFKITNSKCVAVAGFSLLYIGSYFRE